jgi:ERCC4-related helicase
MFNLDRARIHELAGNDTVYAHGRHLHESKQVVRFHWAESGLMLEADVRDRQIVHVRIRLDEEGMPAFRSCTCRENDGAGLCRHQITLLLEARERQRARDAYPGHMSGSLPDGPLHLRTLLILPPNPSMTAAVELEIGSSILRPVLDAALFLHAWHTGSQTQAVNDSTLSAMIERTRLPISSQQLADWLADFAEALVPQRPRSIFSDQRSLRMPSPALALFLPLASATGTAFWTDATRRQIFPLDHVEATSLPLSLLLDGQLRLHVESEEALTFVDDSFSVFRMGNRLYIPSAESILALLPIIEAMYKSKKSVLSLTVSEATRFIVEQMPEIKKHYVVTLAPEAAVLANPAPLLTRVSLGVSGRSITAGIRFCYGSWETDPLLMPGTAELSPMRDRVSESLILRQFRLAGFMPVENSLALHGDELQYRFLRDTLPQLRREALLEESDSFSLQMRIHAAPIAFSLTPGKSPGWLQGTFAHTEDAEGMPMGKGGLPGLLVSLKNGFPYHRSPDGRFFSLEEDGLPLLTAILDDPSIRVASPRPISLKKAGDAAGTGDNGKSTAKTGDAATTAELEDPAAPECAVYDIPAFRLPALAGFQTATAFMSDAAAGASRNFSRFHLDEHLHALADQLAHPEKAQSGLPVLPDSLDLQLRDYQKTGWRWLLTLTRYGFGGILADDMGLGKTVQVIALLHTLHTMPELAGKPALIVAPSSLLLNWKAEFQKFAPELPVVVMDGTHEERMSLLRQANDAVAVITSYPLIRRDIGSMRSVPFSVCILDEAQHIKNPGTANARSVKQIQAAHRFAVTGTPMENTPTELWSVFDFLMPGCLLSHRQFQLRYELPILKDGDAAVLKSLARLVRPFILRRLKTDVLQELPDKIETLSQCGMTKEQKRMYLAFLKKARKSFEETVRQDGAGQSRIRIFALLTRLRQICCDPELVEPGCGAGSGKLEQLLEVLEDALDAGHRVLLFSQFTSMLDIMDKALEDRHIERLRLDGRTPINKRLQLVNAFNAGKGRVFLISLKAGGTGLNLTGADMVIHYDPWWNPAVEDQATDRAHRIGQLQTVQVIRMVTRGTIEEKIQKLQEKKRNMIEQVIKPGGTFLDALSMEEIKGLFEG